MQVKIFCGDDPGALEDEINNWLEDHPNALLWKVTQSESGESDWIITITVWYKGG